MITVTTVFSRGVNNKISKIKSFEDLKNVHVIVYGKFSFIFHSNTYNTADREIIGLYKNFDMNILSERKSIQRAQGTAI